MIRDLLGYLITRRASSNTKLSNIYLLDVPVHNHRA